MRPLILLVSILLAACATYEAKDVVPPVYRVGNAELSQTKEDARITYAEVVNSNLDRASTSSLDQPLKVLYAPMPDYPQRLRDKNVEGVVDVRFTIELDGTVSNASVGGWPNGDLKDVSLAAIRKWKFEPPMRNGKPVRCRTLQLFTFKVQ